MYSLYSVLLISLLRFIDSKATDSKTLNASSISSSASKSGSASGSVSSASAVGSTTSASSSTSSTPAETKTSIIMSTTTVKKQSDDTTNTNELCVPCYQEAVTADCNTVQDCIPPNECKKVCQDICESKRAKGSTGSECDPTSSASVSISSSSPTTLPGSTIQKNSLNLINNAKINPLN